MPSSRLRLDPCRAGGRLALAAIGMWTGGATAASVLEFIDTLTPAQADEFAAWRSAKMKYDRQLDAYWDEIEKKRAGRRAKRGSTKFFDTDDYVWSYPPTYQGPRLSADLDQRWSRFLAQGRQEQPPQEKKELPGLADFLAAARKHYGFEPARIPEREFKRRYAEEAISLGLTKEQVVRVYALETGGDGTADMQAGINPITKKGKPISSALGYAQLLHANTIGELVKHGDSSSNGCSASRPASRDPARIDELHRKIASLQADDPQRQVGARRLVQARRLRPDVEGLRHSRHQPRRRHRALAAVAEAARPQGLRRPQGRDEHVGRGDRDHEPFRSRDRAGDDAAGRPDGADAELLRPQAPIT